MNFDIGQAIREMKTNLDLDADEETLQKMMNRTLERMTP